MFPNVIIVGMCIVLFCRASIWSLCQGECCYFLSRSAVNWKNGHDLCKAMGSDYASIHSDEENEYVANTVCGGKDCWLGLTDANTEGKWEWTDGSDLDYTNWDTHEPNGCCGTADYGGIFKNDKWHDIDENWNNIYAVCKKCDNPTLTPTAPPSFDPSTTPTDSPSSDPTTATLEGWVISSLNRCLEIIEEVNSFRDVDKQEPRRRTDEELDDEHLAARITDQLEVCSGILRVVYSFKEGDLTRRPTLVPTNYPLEPTDECSVELCEHDHKPGKCCIKKDLGLYNIGTFGGSCPADNTLSKITIKGSCVIRVYEHADFKGDSSYFEGPGSWNSRDFKSDAVSSFKFSQPL